MKEVEKSLLFRPLSASRFRLRGYAAPSSGREKRSKKNFDSHGVTSTVSHTPEGEQSFFGSFFSKKELLNDFSGCLL
jgi:hypothetical protein